MLAIKCFNKRENRPPRPFYKTMLWVSKCGEEYTFSSLAHSPLKPFLMATNGNVQPGKKENKKNNEILKCLFQMEILNQAVTQIFLQGATQCSLSSTEWKNEPRNKGCDLIIPGDLILIVFVSPPCRLEVLENEVWKPQITYMCTCVFIFVLVCLQA